MSLTATQPQPQPQTITTDQGVFPYDARIFRSVLNDGFAASNARRYATLGAYRVTWGFGVFENFATEIEAVRFATEKAAT